MLVCQDQMSLVSAPDIKTALMSVLLARRHSLRVIGMPLEERLYGVCERPSAALLERWRPLVVRVSNRISVIDWPV